VRKRVWLQAILAALVIGLPVGCGSGGSSSEAPGPAPAPTQVSVSVAPKAASISTIETQRFTATVTDAADSSVTWRVDGIAGGNAEVGTISADGLFTPARRQALHTISATSVADVSQSAETSLAVTLVQGVLTYHNDNARSGQNLVETVLTPANVGGASFGKIGSFAVDGFVYAQPLYVARVPLADRLHDLVIVVTEHASVYAFDAGDVGGLPLWQRSFIDNARGITTVPSADTGCDDITPEIGITSTPVVDPVTGTLYVVAMTKENAVHVHRLHALALDTGRELVEGGTRIQASVAGMAVPDDGTGRQVFASVRENQRAALLLSNGIVHVAFGSFCDYGDHHGWLMTFDATTLRQLGALSTTPQGTEGGIWQSGGGPAADADGKIFLATGDGSFDAARGGRNYGNSFLKLGGADLVVLDYFTPYNEATLHDNDGDLGSGGVLLLPDQQIGPPRLMVGAGKQGIVYLMNRDDMGHHQVDSDSQIVQSFPVGACASGACPVFGTPAQFNGKVYLAPAFDRLRAFTLGGGRLSPSSESAGVFRWPGATPVVSADATRNGIVWTVETNGSGAPAVLRAHAAADVSIELFSSSRNATRDPPGAAVKFAAPMVFGGRVYVGVQGAVAVYGLLP
jgi:hypothetical protein